MAWVPDWSSGWPSGQSMMDYYDNATQKMYEKVLADPNADPWMKEDAAVWAKWRKRTLDTTAQAGNAREKSDLEKTLEQAYDFDLTYGKYSGQSPTQTAATVADEIGGSHWFVRYTSNISIVVLGILFIVLAFFVSDMGKSAMSKV